MSSQLKFYYKYIGEKPLLPFVWLCVSFLLYLGIIKKCKNMKKFKNVVDAKDGIGKVINDLILGNMETDYNDYELGDRVTYEFWLDEDFEDYNDDCNINEIKEFVGEGVCLEDKELSDIWGKDIWYNVSIRKSISSYFKGESLFIEFLADETMCEKI